MKVLVTGSAGFIGTAVLRRLDDLGHSATGYDRQTDPADELIDLRRLRAAIRGQDAIIHLAAKVGLGVNLSDLDGYARDNDLGTAVLLRAAAEESVRRVVLASSMVVYGEGRARCPEHGTMPVPPRATADLACGRFEPRCAACGSELQPHLVTEEARLDPRNGYAATKVQLEQFARIWARESGGTAIALRYHNVYGPGLPRDTPYAGVAAIFRSTLAAGRPPRVFEDGRQRRDFVHVDDVAAATVAALECQPEQGFTALNVGSGRVTTIGEVARRMAMIMDGPEPVITGDYRLGDVRHITADSSAARTLLHWSPQVDLDAGLRTLQHPTCQHQKAL
ncbi:NAD-dependent epimerase/dehydratase family protein [Microlunatus elymi]|uniref:NAD-dependent epimerase/dehydratase family protein n=1 Tax=Microlunatus elymi TaxID=2596828 RepID=A0A516PY94_9ACTN|nr:NAD-dependent epimerase/dehydratase family protein [Microlunatus elymi]QDP96149.1 NAD-dependent epimerase/dehydratase family protein [Microlunatus elymi]